MINRFKKIVFHPLFAGSAVMIIGSNLSNVLAFVYHLIIGRLLNDPSLYGELAAVISLAAMFSAFFSFLSFVVVKFVSAAKDRNELTAVIAWFGHVSLYVGVGMFLLTLVFTPVFSNFLKIDATILILVPFFLFFGILSMALRSLLQGLMKFFQMALSLNIEFFLRLALGVLFVWIGMGVFGAVLGIVAASLVGFLVTLYFLKDFTLLKKVKEFKLGKTVIAYSLPAFLFSFTSTSFLTADTLLAKHFIDAHSAGIYAALSTLGKIILYGTGPVAIVMFPMVSQRHARGQRYVSIFLLSILLALGMSAVVLAVYYFFPDLAITVLYGESFLEGKDYLIWFGLFAAVYSLASLISSFYMSVGKTRVVVFPVIFSLLQVMGIILWHDSILTIIHISLASATFLLLALVIYFTYDQGCLKKRTVRV